MSQNSKYIVEYRERLPVLNNWDYRRPADNPAPVRRPYLYSMLLRLDVICIALAVYHSGDSTPASDDEVKKFLNQVFQESNKENINKVFTVQTKDNQLILESVDVRLDKAVNGSTANTVQIMVGSKGNKPATHTISQNDAGIEAMSKAGW